MVNKKKKVNYADIGFRFLAHILDNIIQLFLAGMLLLIFLGIPIIIVNMIYTDPKDTPLAILYAVFVVIASFFVVSFYNQAYRVQKTGSSLGKQIMKIKIVKDSQKPADWNAALTRWIVKAVLLKVLGIIGLIIYIVPMLSRDDKKSIADMAAETIVVKK